VDYQVELDVFRGPLDLLLYLVKRQEMDICDIPIAQVAAQFLDHLRGMNLVDVEVAGDFLVMAATLMEIKSRMLLPATEESDEEEADPRRELVRQLLEYKKFKEAAVLLEMQAERQASRQARHPSDVPIPPDLTQQPLQAVELWDLVSAFGRLMHETMALQPQQIVADETPIHIYQERILEQLKLEGRATLSALFTTPRTRARLVGLFLAILELIKAKQIVMEQEVAFGDIVVHMVSVD
jgi:segregation and condensation protein A